MCCKNNKRQLPPPPPSIVKDLQGTSYNNNNSKKNKYWAYLTSDLNGKSQHATLKNLGSDHILMPFYLKKIKLFFSFGYNYFNHMRRSLRNEHPN